MPLILTTPPSAEPVTLAEMKAQLRIGHDDEDAQLTLFIAAARRHVEAETGLALIEQGWSLLRDDWPESGVVEIPLSPVSAIGSVIVYGDDGTPATIDPAHYYADMSSRPPRLLLRGSRVWARPGRIGNGIAIAFTAGFGTAAASVPEDLREATLLLAAYAYENRAEVKSAPAVPLTVSAILARHREVRL